MSPSKKDTPYSSQLKGVAAFLSQPASEETSQSNSISIGSIRLPNQQPRRYFDPEKLNQLVASIKEHGILEPLLVRPLPNNQYELVAGERRYKAALIIGLNEIPVVIRDLSNEEALQLALVENLQREDLNPIEETEGILQLIGLRLQITVEETVLLLYRMQNEAKGKVTPNVLGNSQGQFIQEIFDALGSISWSSFVNSRLPLLKMPDGILDALRQGKIAYTKAQAIARVKNEGERTEILEVAVTQDLSLSQIKEKIAATNSNSDGGVADSDDEPPIKQRFDVTYRKIKKSKVWNDPQKKKKLEKLLFELQSLIEEE